MTYRKIFIIPFLIIIFNCSSSTQNPQIDITNYNLQVNLDSLQNKVNVTAIVKLNKSDVLNEFELLLNSNFKIKSIKSKIKDNWVDISYNLKENNIIRLIIPSPLIDHNEFTMMFEYNFPTKGLKDVFYIDRGYRWYPMIVNDIAQLKITANIPAEFEMFSAGDLVEINHKSGFSQFTWETKIPVFKIPFVLIKSNQYKKITRKCEDKDIYFYFLTDDLNANEKFIDEACHAFQYYNTSIAPYHHNCLTFIEMSNFQGSNICTGLILSSSNVIDQFKKGYYKGLHLTIAAQWFGAGVFGKFNDKGFWFFSLSLPHYLRLMYIKESNNTDAFVKQLEKPYHDYEAIAGTDKDVPIIDVDRINTREKGLVIYGKGPFVLDILKGEMGENNWKHFIRELYLNNVGKILTYDIFKNNLKKYDKSGNLVLKFDKIMIEKGIIKN